MSADTFIDTNVLAYMFDASSPSKQATAQSLVAQVEFVTSSQVLGELYVTLTRKLAVKVAPETAAATIAELSNLPVIPVSGQLVGAAIDTASRFQLSYWDALIIETAALAGCTTLLTEDLNDQAVIRGVRIVNPFRAA